MIDIQSLREERNQAQMNLARAQRHHANDTETIDELRTRFATARAKVAIAEALEGYPPLSERQKRDIRAVLTAA